MGRKASPLVVAVPEVKPRFLQIPPGLRQPVATALHTRHCNGPQAEKPPTTKEAGNHTALSQPPTFQPLSRSGGASESLPAEALFARLSTENGRLLIRGDAGSGKSTLARWAAMKAAAGPLRLRKIDDENR